METNTVDTKCMFDILNVTHLFNEEAREQKSKNGRSDDLVTSQYSTLTKPQIRALYEVYKYDFEAFEYDYKSFLDLAVEGITQEPTATPRY